MKTKVLALCLLLSMLLGVTAQAGMVEPMAHRIAPKIAFQGTTATCTVTVSGFQPSDRILVKATLWHGDTCLHEWRTTGSGQVSLNKSTTVKKGETYTLIAEIYVNSIKNSTKTVTATCP